MGLPLRYLALRLHSVDPHRIRRKCHMCYQCRWMPNHLYQTTAFYRCFKQCYVHDGRWLWPNCFTNQQLQIQHKSTLFQYQRYPSWHQGLAHLRIWLLFRWLHWGHQVWYLTSGWLQRSWCVLRGGRPDRLWFHRLGPSWRRQQYFRNSRRTFQSIL